MDQAALVEMLRELARVRGAHAHNDQLMERVGEFVSEMSSFGLVFECLGHADDQVVTGATALLVPVVIGAHFPSFPSEQKNTYFTRLMAMLNDNSASVARTQQLAIVIAHLIACEEEVGEDTDATRSHLLGVVARLAASALPADRARGLRLLSVLENELGDMVGRIHNFDAGLSMAAAEESPEVQHEAARMVLTLALQEDAEPWDYMMATYFPWLLERLVPAIQATDMFLAMLFFDAVVSNLERDPAWLNVHLDQIIARTFDIIPLPGFQHDVLDAALQMINALIALRPKLLTKRKLIQPMATRCIELLCSVTQQEVKPPDVDLTDSAVRNDDTPVHMLLNILDHIAAQLPPKHTYQAVTVQLAQRLMSNDLQSKRVGAVGLGFVAEGFAQVLREQLSDVVPLLIQSLQTNDDALMEGILFALAELRRRCLPEMFFYDSMLIEAVTKLLGQATSPPVLARAHYAISFQEEPWSEEVVEEFAEELMPRLAQNAIHPDRQVRTTALGAMALFGASMEQEDFAPFVPNVSATLRDLVQSEDRVANFKGLELAARLGSVMGFEQFRPLIEGGLLIVQNEFAEATFAEESQELEIALKFITSGVQSLGDAAEAHLTWLVPVLVRASNLELLTHGDTEVGVGSVEMRILAINALAEVCQACNKFIWPYVPALRSLLTHMQAQYHLEHGTYVHALYLYVSVAMATWHKSEVEARGLVPTFERGEAVELPGDVKQVIDQAVQFIVSRLQSEEDATCVSTLVLVLEMLVEKFGVSAIADFEDELLEQIGVMARGESPAQQIRGDDNDDDEDEVTGDAILEAAIDFVEESAAQLGMRIIPYFEQTFVATSTCFDPNGAYLLRDRMMGMFSTVFLNIGASSAHYLDRVLPLVQQGLRDKGVGVRQNSAYTLRVLCEQLTEQLLPHFPTFLQWLYPVCQRKRKDEGAAATDNALAAVAVMIQLAGDAIPLETVLPPFLASLPLEKDEQEYHTIVSCLVHLVTSQHPVAMQHLPKIVSVLVAAIASEALPTEKEAAIRQLFRQFASALAASVDDLSADDKRLLTEFLSKQESAVGEEEA